MTSTSSAADDVAQIVETNINVKRRPCRVVVVFVECGLDKDAELIVELAIDRSKIDVVLAETLHFDGYFTEAREAECASVY